MWSVYTVIAYFVLALLIPIGITAAKIWKKTRESRRVACPRDGLTALVGLDRGYAFRMHLLGNPELLVRRMHALAGIRRLRTELPRADRRPLIIAADEPRGSCVAAAHRHRHRRAMR